MDDAKAGYQATPNATLEQQMMDACAPKSEREWWAFVEIGRLRAEVESLRENNHGWLRANGPGGWIDALRADAEKKDALLVRAHDMLGCVGCSPEGASKDIRMAKELQRDIDAARAAQEKT